MSIKETLHILANIRSGQGVAERVARRVLERCRAEGVRAVLHASRHRREMRGSIMRACTEARADGGRVLVIGGDGTIRSVSEVLCGTEIPLAVIPTGTFNFFARNLGIPLEVDAALELALSGNPRAVNLGRVNDHVFNNNASFGLYARMIKAREEHSRRFGRHRVVAILSTLFTLLKGYRALYLTLETDGHTRTVQSPMVFVGINSLQMRGVNLDIGHCMKEPNLGVVVMKPSSGWGLLRLCIRGLARRLSDEESLEHFCTQKIEIRPNRKHITVVLDGERQRIVTPLRFDIVIGGLQVIAPSPEDAP
ncbi:Transcription regulator protein [Marinobacterium lacunae]|uniref:Transcription regulator protein n=1 Tax=Marinobacterium lacunae TaxID=1232683 RepID=A0A081FUB0_9GAMM|nr:diacylglycerol kinase family protein [Marinobacterium lacunae]KEA62115.1 Transcription regulator protein [Marinobacterium lacunae]